MDLRRILIGGVVASLVLAMWEMIIEAVIPAGLDSSARRSPSVPLWSGICRVPATRFRLMRLPLSSV